MFTNSIASLRRAVVVRQQELHQHKLNERRWSVRKTILQDVDGRFIDSMEFAIASSYTDYAYTATLCSFSSAELDTEADNGTTLREVIEKTDVLERVANRLAPGFFKCRLRHMPLRFQRAGEEKVFEVVARFYPEGFEPVKPPCTCVCSYLTDGFCDTCGGHNVRNILRHPRAEEVSAPQINNPEDM
jgi:hypothetical protein